MLIFQGILLNLKICLNNIKNKMEKKQTPAEKEYTISLREKVRSVPRYKKTNKAVRTIKEFLVRHMKIYNRDLNKIKIDKSRSGNFYFLNNFFIFG